MKKILSAVVTTAILASAVFAVPTSAHQFTTGEAGEAGIEWSMPVEADGGFEHPGVWTQWRYDQYQASKSGITAKDAANGRRSFYTTFNPETAQFKDSPEDPNKKIDSVIYYNTEPTDWRSLYQADLDEHPDWGAVNSYFFTGDLKMTEDFKGIVYVRVNRWNDAPWTGFLWGADSTEFMLFNNTSAGYKIGPYGYGNDNPEDYKDWKRARTQAFNSDALQNLLLESETKESGGTRLMIGVRCFSGSVWLDNVDIWNNGEQNFGGPGSDQNHRYPEYTPDEPGTVADDGSITMLDFEDDEFPITSYPYGFRQNYWYNQAGFTYDRETLKEKDGMEIVNDSSVAYKGNKCLKVEFKGNNYETHITDPNNMYCGGYCGATTVARYLFQSDLKDLDLTTKYHLEFAVKSTKDAKFSYNIYLKHQGVEGVEYISNQHLYSTELTYTGNGIGWGAVDEDWDIYSTPSFYILGSKLELEMHFRNKGGTSWFDDVRLVPDNIKKNNGKITSTYDEGNGDFTFTATADKGYELGEFKISGKGGAYAPVLVDRIDVNTAVYKFNTKGKGYEDKEWINIITDFKKSDFDDEYPMGDANKDAKVDILDLIRVKKYLVGAIDYAAGMDIYLNAVNFVDDDDVKSDDLAALSKLLLNPAPVVNPDGGEGGDGDWHS